MGPLRCAVPMRACHAQVGSANAGGPDLMQLSMVLMPGGHTSGRISALSPQRCQGPRQGMWSCDDEDHQDFRRQLPG